MIGRSWLAALDPNTGRRRLENANDYVRLEIKTALERNVRLIPVLVQQASMPLETELPADIAALSRCNALELGDQHWKAGVERLRPSRKSSTSAECHSLSVGRARSNPGTGSE